MVCALGMLTACKSGTADNTADSTYATDVAESRLYDIVKRGDTLLVVCDPEGLFYGQPLAGCVSTEWIIATYPKPNFKTMTDHEMFPHEDGVCTCGPETFWVVGRNDTLCFQEIDEFDTTSAEKWMYTCGQIRDTLMDFGGLRIGMNIESVAARLHMSDTIDIHNFKVIHLVAPDLFTEPVYEKLEWGGWKVIDQTNPDTFQYDDVPRIGYAGVELLIERGKVTAINTGWYMASSHKVVWGV